MNDGEIEFCKKIEGNMVAVTQEDGQQDETPKPLIIYYKGGNQTKAAPQPSALKIIVKVLAPFHYQNDKAVPWRYTCNVTTPRSLVIPFSSESTSEQTINDITGVGGMTRSGRCYAPGLMGVGQEEKSMDKYYDSRNSESKGEYNCFTTGRNQCTGN